MKGDTAKIEGALLKAAPEQGILGDEVIFFQKLSEGWVFHELITALIKSILVDFVVNLFQDETLWGIWENAPGRNMFSFFVPYV